MAEVHFRSGIAKYETQSTKSKYQKIMIRLESFCLLKSLVLNNKTKIDILSTFILTVR